MTPLEIVVEKAGLAVRTAADGSLFLSGELGACESADLTDEEGAALVKACPAMDYRSPRRGAPS